MSSATGIRRFHQKQKMNPIENACPSCGRPVPPDAPYKLCPLCLVAGGFSKADATARGEATSTSTLHIVIPEDAPLLNDAPRRLGKYEILEMIAHGGMGVVYKARHVGLDRIVAIKMIRSGVLASSKDVERFQREARSAAKLHHPNIVAIHDIGEQDGQHYFSMDYVPGENLAQLARKRPFSPRQAAEIAAGVAAAIHYAHQQGVLHRDIKPANVILTPDHQPHVLDFGLALVVADGSSLTLSGAPMGSPSYMPPEQAAGQTRKTDKRSDVYSLGAMLYELLTGRPPFQAASAVETLQLVVENEPVSPRRLNPALPQDLETICLKCLEKAPDRRYQSAQELGDEIGRFLRGETILARPVQQVEKVWRWCRRKPAIAGLATATLLLLLAVAIGSPIAVWRITAARDAERVQRQRAEVSSGDLVKSLYAADMRTAWQSLQGDNLLVAREAIYKYLPALGIPVSSELEGLRGHLPAGAVTRELLGWEWRHLWALAQSEELFTLHGDGLEIRCVVFSPDSRLVATGRGRTVYITDAHTKKQLAALDGFSGVINNSAIAFSNDGRYLVAKGGTNVVIWEVGHWSAPYKQLHGASNKHHGNAVVFSPDDRRLVTPIEGGLGVWDTTTWQKQLVPGSFGFGMYLRYTAEGKWLAASEWKELKILNAESLEVEWVFPREQDGNFIMFALDSCRSRNLLAAGYLDGIVRIWETTSHPRSWREVARFQPHPSFTFGLVFSPDGGVVATGGSDQLIKVWDVTTLTNQMAATPPPKPLRKLRGNRAMSFPGRLPPKDGPQPVTTLRGHHAAIHGLSFAPDGKSIVSASKDGTAKFWNTFSEVKSDSLPDSRYLAWFAQDGTRLITLNYDSHMHHWDTRERRDLGAIGPNLDKSKAWTVSEDGKMLAIGWENGEVEIWSIENNKMLKSLPHLDAKIAHLAFSSDAHLIAAASERAADGNEKATLRIWDIASGAIAGTYHNAYGPLAFSSDKQRLVSTRLDGTVVVWNLANGSPTAEIGENFTWIGDLTLSSDGRLLVTGSEEPVVNISELATGKRIDSLKGSGMCVVGVAFTPDSKTLASRTVDGVMRFWHGPTGKEMFTVGPLDGVNSFLFSPNGEYLAVSRGEEERGEQRMILWRAPSFEEIIAAEKAKLGKAGTAR